MDLTNKKIFVTGGAGFIGGHLVDYLMKNNRIVVYDNLSSGKEEFIESHFDNPNFTFVKGDILDLEKLKSSMKGCDFVFHLAANPDIRYGEKITDHDLKQNVIGTYNVLEAMRSNAINKICFSSTSALYGETEVIPTPESYGPLKPISLYGASKLAGEAYISAFVGLFDFQGWIYRFANVVGPRGTHGALFDWINKLKENKDELEVLGDGSQTKSYLSVQDCIEGIIYGIENSDEKLSLFNLGSDDQFNVKGMAELLIKEMGTDTKIRYTGGDRGWKSDVPIMKLDTKLMTSAGWSAKHNSEEAVRICVKALMDEIL